MSRMKVSIGLVIVIAQCLLSLVGRGKKEERITNQGDPILSSIERIPEMIHSRRWREADRFVYSNICCSIRGIANKEQRVVYTRSYTNLVARIAPVRVAETNTAATALNDWRIAMENYCDFVRWGTVLMSENLDMNPEAWDFLLLPIFLLRQEIQAHQKRLFDQNVDSRHVEKNAHIQMLDGLLYRCTYEIKRIWYPEAKRKLAPEQLQQVRQKVKKALGELPPEMAKDE